MKQKHNKTLDDMEVGKSIEVNGYDYDKTQRKPTCFNRWMNLVDNFV